MYISLMATYLLDRIRLRSRRISAHRASRSVRSLEDSPFEICDYSVKEPFTGDWKKKSESASGVREQPSCICGEHTHEAMGVVNELTVAQEEELTYFLLWGYKGKTCYAPTSAKATDKN